MMNVPIAKPTYIDTVLYKDGDTADIMTALLKEAKVAAPFTEQFAGRFSRDREGMKALWAFVKNNIPYKEDPPDVQWIQTPARAWDNRKTSLGGTGNGADCKSYTLFIISILQNLGVDYTIRFVGYSAFNKNVTHVYPIAKINGKAIIVDAVWDRFDSEKKFKFKKDYNMAQIVRLAGIEGAENSALATSQQEWLKNIEEVTRNLPSAPIDFTKMSSGEVLRAQELNILDHFLAKGNNFGNNEARLARNIIANGAVITGIGSSSPIVQAANEFVHQTARLTAPAFKIPNISGNAIGSWVGDAWTWVKDKFKDFLYWVFTKQIPLTAPFFTYAYLREEDYAIKITGELKRKKDKQLKTIAWITKVTGAQDNVVWNAYRNELGKKFGMTPEAWWRDKLSKYIPLFLTPEQKVAKEQEKGANLTDINIRKRGSADPLKRGMNGIGTLSEDMNKFLKDPENETYIDAGKKLLSSVAAEDKEARRKAILQVTDIIVYALAGAVSAATGVGGPIIIGAYELIKALTKMFNKPDEVGLNDGDTPGSGDWGQSVEDELKKAEEERAAKQSGTNGIIIPVVVGLGAFLLFKK